MQQTLRAPIRCKTGYTTPSNGLLDLVTGWLIVIFYPSFFSVSRFCFSLFEIGLNSNKKPCPSSFIFFGKFVSECDLKLPYCNHPSESVCTIMCGCFYQKYRFNFNVGLTFKMNALYEMEIVFVDDRSTSLRL
jgi:hypothetical protein